MACSPGGAQGAPALPLWPPWAPLAPPWSPPGSPRTPFYPPWLPSFSHVPPNALFACAQKSGLVIVGHFMFENNVFLLVLACFLEARWASKNICAARLGHYWCLRAPPGPPRNSRGPPTGPPGPPRKTARPPRGVPGPPRGPKFSGKTPSGPPLGVIWGFLKNTIFPVENDTF